MKRKASKQLSKRGESEGGSIQVASLVSEIDPNGDLQVDLVDRTNDSDGQLRGLLVSRHTLRLSSPVFRTMLADDSPFQESRDKTTNKNGIQVIRFDDDDVASMEILMNAIHLQNHKVPITITIAQLEELAIVCDKYDIRCLGPWTEMWSQPYVYQPSDGLTRLLFVAMVFRLADWFIRLTRDVILDTISSSEGVLLWDDSSRFREGVPQSILDRIAERRTEVISQLLELCWQQSLRLRTTRGHCRLYWKSERERRNCDLMNLGSLSLQDLDLPASPLDAVDLDSKTARDILLSVRKLSRMSDVTETDDQFTSDHRDCCIGADLITQASKIINTVDGIELEAVASEAPPQHSTLLSHLSSLVKRFDVTSDPPSYEAVLRLTAIPIDTQLWREVPIECQATAGTRFAWCPKLKCNHCPGFEYSLFQHLNDDDVIIRALEKHFDNSLHCERVRRRRREIRRRTRLETALAT